MEVALYEILTDVHRYQYLNEATKYQEKNEQYIRISNIVEIEFEMIDEAFIIPKKVDKLRAEKAVAAEEFDEKIGKLLSITHQPDAEEELFEPAFGEPEKDSVDPTEPFLDVTEPIEGEEEGT